MFALVHHQDYLLHRPPDYHPESPERLRWIEEGLKEAGLWERALHLEPRPASEEELSLVHTSEHINYVASAWREGRRWLDPDTYICSHSYDVAKLAVGGVFRAVDEVCSGDERIAFCLVRPPGHHAEPDRSMGFCLFNNVALGARYAQRTHGVGKVLIVDWDLHHGNGTQAAFWDDPSVFYFSVHLFPYYPGTGRADERGKGPGEGYTLNVPLPWGSDDDAYERAFRERLLPEARRFRPELVMISAGFDAHRADPLSGMEVTEEGFLKMAEMVSEVAKEYAGGRIVSVLEGGYHRSALPRSAVAHLKGLLS